MKERPHTELAEAAKLLAQAWQRRSPGERSAFVSRPGAASARPEHDEATLRAVRERAALSGAVAPEDLVRGFGREDADWALDLIAQECDRVQEAGKWVWTLRSGPRRDSLVRLAASGDLGTALEEVTGIPTDPAGEALRAVAATGSVPDASPATTAQALAWAQPLGGLAGDLAEAQRQAAVASLRASYDALVGHGVFGRDAELARLRAFAAETPEPAGPVPVLPVTGIGGAGKSTVIGWFLRPYLDSIAAGDLGVPAVVVIDFDRVLFRPGAELELSFELTRQLGLAAPVAAADFSALRYQARAGQAQSASDAYRSATYSSAHEASGFESEAGILVQMHGLDHRPVLLVLDTFEEWQREQPDPAASWLAWNTPQAEIMDWIGRVRYGMGLEGLRVIISGRGDLTAGTRPQLSIGDLESAAARDLAQALGVLPDDSAAFVGQVGCNPLTLHVAARFYRGLPVGARCDFLEGDPAVSQALSNELRRAVLYGRFLNHIRDKKVRKLAHPGLVLRRVTADLMRQVLAGPCGLGSIDQATAEELTARLAAEVWLVNRTPDGLHHRSDVRRPMLRLMAEDPRQSAVARRIHADAADWYESGRDRLLAPDDAKVEAFYHRLMMQSGDEPVTGLDEAADSGPGARWVRLAQALGRAVDELPPKVAAQVRALRGDQISDADAALLPGPVWRHWVSRHGADLVEAGLATVALEAFGARPAAAEPPWLAQAYSDAARWEEYWRTAHRLRPSAPDPDAWTLRSGRYAMLAALLSPADMVDYDHMLATYLDRATARGEPAVIFERLFLHLLCTFGVPASGQYRAPRAPWQPPKLTDQMLRHPASRGGEQGIIDRYPVDQLRRVMVWIAAPGEPGEFVIEKPAALFRPDPQWMLDFAGWAGAESKELDSLRDDLRARGPRTRADQLLGEWALRYTRLLGSNLIRLDRSRVREGARWIHVLRGDNPELRPAVMLALADVAAEPGGMRELLEIAQPLLPVCPADLDPDGGLTTGRRALAQLVDYVDRSGVMPGFVARARDARPRSALLGRVATALRVWDDAHRRLLDALAERLAMAEAVMARSEEVRPEVWQIADDLESITASAELRIMLESASAAGAPTGTISVWSLSIEPATMAWSVSQPEDR